MNKKIKGHIYIHKNKLNGKCYVGQTIWTPVKRRWGKNGIYYRKDSAFGRAIKKYGWNNFEHIIIPTIYETIEELNKAEQEMIIEVDSFNNGYNSTMGGDNHTRTKEVGRKISKSKMGHKVSEETREKLRQVNLGKTYGEETKRKHSENGKNFRHTEITKKRLRASHIKKKVLKFDLDNNFIKEYACLNDVAREYGSDVRSNIKKCIKGEINYAYGFKWKFGEEYI